MLVFSILGILIVNGGKLKGFGFIMPTKFQYVKLALSAIGITIASFVVGMVVFIIILSNLFPIDSIGGSTVGFPKEDSIVEMILTVWIWSSLCEEVFTRGFLYGTIQHLDSKKFLRLSIPVWISGIFFGLMHTQLIHNGMSFWFVAFIVFNTTIIGLVAAYYREKSGSLFPAFLVHFLANVVGSFPIFINQIIN
jgi:membrane protease YdiL (CAAX protease family)